MLVKDVSSTENTINLLQNLEDPATWPALTDKIKKFLVEHEPIQKTDIIYTKTNGRKFSNAYYYRKLSNTENIRRNWLIYSVKADGVYCFCCKLFALEEENNSLLVAENGYNDWKNLTNLLHSHETSAKHVAKYKRWIYFKKSLEEKNTIDSQTEILYEIEFFFKY